MQSPESASGVPTELCAYAGRYYRVTRYILSLVLIGYGFWAIHDGWYAWPRENLDYIQHGADKPLHTDLDILLNKVLGLAFPPIGVALLIWTLYNSRGRYRLAADMLEVPGHPPIPLDKIEEVNKSQWDRKGIARIKYRLNDGVMRELALDDFVYEQTATDAIFAKVEKSLAGEEA